NFHLFYAGTLFCLIPSSMASVKVMYGPIVVFGHMQHGYLRVSTIFDDFLAVVWFPYLLGLVPTRESSPIARGNIYGQGRDYNLTSIHIGDFRGNALRANSHFSRTITSP